MGVLGALGRSMAGLDKAALSLTSRMNLLKVAAVGAISAFAGYETLKVMDKLITKGAELTQQQSLLRRAGVSETDIQLRTAEAYNVALTVQGTKVAENLKMFGELRSQVSTDKQAADLLPFLAQIGVLVENETGKKADKLAQTMMMVLENRGQVFDKTGHTMDLEKVKNELNLAYKAMSISHGMITPATFLNFQKQAGVAGSAMSPEAYYGYMPTVMQTMGGHRAGTALTSMFAQMVGGVMTKRIAESMNQLHLLDMSKVHYGKRGQVRLDPGAVKDFDPYNPFKYGAVLKAAIEKYAPKGSRAMDGLMDPRVVQTLYRTLGRDTARRVMAEFILLAPTFERDFGLRQRAMSVENAAKEARENFNLAKKSLAASYDNLETALGAPLVPLAVSMLRKLTDQLNRMVAWASTNPAVVQSLGEIVVGFGLLFGVGGVLAIGGAAITALGVLAGPLGLVGLAAGILLLFGSMKSDQAGASPRERIGAGLSPDNASTMAIAMRSMLPSTQQVYDAFKEFAPRVILGLGAALLDLGAALQRSVADLDKIIQREMTIMFQSIGAIIVDWVKRLPAQIMAGLGSLGNIFSNTPEGKLAFERSKKTADDATGGTGYLPDMGGTRPGATPQYSTPKPLTPGFTPQSFVPPSAVNSNRTTPIVFHLDGREVARGVIPHIGREMNAAPSGRTGFDTRISPRYAGAVFAA